MTASPAELRLLLLDGAIRFARQANDGLSGKNYEQAFTGFTKCQNIILELLSALDKSQAPDLCDKLAGLYTFMFNRLIQASSAKSTDMVQEVLKLLEYERETWVLAMAKLNGASSGSPVAGAPTSPAVSLTG